MSAGAAGGTPDILLVEDDANFRALAESFLEEAGYSVRPCAGVGQGLAAFRSRKPDLALVDIGLPDGDGFGFCRALKAEGPDVPLVFMTGWASVESRLRGFEAGAQDYLIKPPCWEELVARVRVHLAAKAQQEALTKRNLDLELRNRVRRDAADMIVHDLKAPLSSILGTLELIRGQGMIGSDHYHKLIDVSRSASEMMLLMINDILDVERSEESAMKAEPAGVDLRRLVRRVESLFSPMCQLRRLRFRSQAQDGQAWTDANLLFRILSNLVSNAVKFSPDGGEVTVGCERGRERLRFSVSDEGPGIPDGLKEKVFDRFVRIELPRSPQGGTGIGLAFCRLASKALGGKVWVEDREGGGSRFQLEVPARLN